MNDDKMTWEQYESSDFGLVTFLSLNFPIIEIKKTDPKRSYFVFDKTPELLEAMEKYWKGEARVDPNKYFIQTKIIKSRIYENV